MAVSIFRTHETNQRKFRTDGRRKKTILNANGGSLWAALSEFKKIEVTEDRFFSNTPGDATIGRYAALYEKDGDVFDLIGYDHFNGHFDNFNSGVHEIRLQKVVAI